MKKHFGKLAAAVPVLGGNEDLAAIALRILTRVIFPLFGAIALGFVIYAGILFITSSGDPEKVTTARRSLMYAIFAIVLVVLSFAIVVSFNSIIKTRILR